MWSGGPQWTQWALNPSAYQNVSHEQIDWAALAQQWIKMKESHSVPPPVHLQAPPPPPPPPPLPPPQQRHQEEAKDKEVTRDTEEGGEAPMEMDAKEEEEEISTSTTVAPSTSTNPPVTSAPPPEASGSWGSWNNWQQPQHWGPGWHGPGVGTTATWAGTPSHPPPNHPHAHIAPPAGGKEPPNVSVSVPPPSHQMGSHFPFTPHNASGPMYGEHNHPPSFDYNHGAEGVDHFGQMGFWGTGEGGADMGPSPFIRHNRHGDWRGNRGPPGMPGRPYHDHQSRHGPSEHSDEEDEQSGGTVLDAAKRRQLPAWIREGLEKMEREKMKQLERERMMKEREAAAKKLKDQEHLNASQLQEKEDGVLASNLGTIPKRSKFESDSEDEEEGNPEETNERSMEWRAGVGPLKRRKKSRFQDASSPGSTSPHEVAAGVKSGVGHPNGRRKISESLEDEVDRGRSPPPTPMSREEIMQETMLKVRRLLTEVLLEVTNEEMYLVAKEVLSKAKSKAPAMQLRKTPALATLTGQLGLGMYGDSESSEEESDTGDNSKFGRRRNDAESDSDEELKDQIKRRKQEFAKTEREIEARLQEEEEREREREREREKRSKGEEVLVGEEGGGGETKESTGEEEERQVEKETDTKHPSLQEEGPDTQKPKLSRLPDDKETAAFVGEVKDEKQVKEKDDEVRVGDAKSRPVQASTEKANAMLHTSKKHERKKKESKRKKKVKGTSSQSESHTSSHSSSSTSSSNSSSSSSSSESSSSSRSSSPSSSSESSDSRHQSRKRSKNSKEMSRKDLKGRRGGGSRDRRDVRRRSRSRERSRSRGRGRGDSRRQRDGGSSRREDERERRRSRGRRGSRSPDRKDRRRMSEKEVGSGRRRNSRRSVTPRKGRRSRSRSDRARHNRRSSSRSSSYAELSKKQGHGHRD